MNNSHNRVNHSISPKQEPTSPTAAFSESNSIDSSSSKEKDDMNNNSNPSCLNFQGLKFEQVNDIQEVKSLSPDNSIWKSSLFSPLPPCSSYHDHIGGAQSSTSQKGKANSPLHKILNSQTNRYVKQESAEFPTGMQGFMDDSLNKDGSEIPTTTRRGMLSRLTPLNFSKFCGSVVSQVGVPRGYQRLEQKDIHKSGSFALPSPPVSQKQLPQNLDHGFMGSLTTLTELPEHHSGLQLVHLLLVCAESIAKADYTLARRYLHQLNRVVTPLGDSMQRVASCFTDALGARLAATLTTSPNSSNPKHITPLPPNSPETLKVYQILYQACPYIKFAHFTANQAIFEAFEAEVRVHVIDLDILQGYQWPAFMQALAARPGGPPFLRITGFGSSFESVRETGRFLTELAQSLQVPFEFHPVSEQLGDLKPHMFHRHVGEALAFNLVNQLHRISGIDLVHLLGTIQAQAPSIVTLVEQEANHNGSDFMGRFLEALHYYSAIFDSLDATFPSHSVERAKVEQYIFATEIKNIVSCEGAERVERHEKLDKWRKVMEGVGFKGVPLSPDGVRQSKVLLSLYSCDGYRLTVDEGCLILGWQDRAIIAASAWGC